MRITQPPITSAGIIAALGFTPASAGAVVMNGTSTAASPGMFFGSDINTGFYLSSADVLGITAGGLQTTLFEWADVAGFTDGVMRMHLGRDQTFVGPGDGSIIYPVGILGGAYTVEEDVGLTAAFVFNSTVTLNSGTKTHDYINFEVDRLNIESAGGAVNITGLVGAQTTVIPVLHTNVTGAMVYAHTVVVPYAAQFTGTTPDIVGFHFPQTTDVAFYQPSNGYTALYLEPGWKAIRSEATADIVIESGADISITTATNGILDLISAGSSGQANLSGGTIALASSSATTITAGTALTLTAGSASGYAAIINAPHANGTVDLQNQGRTGLRVAGVGTDGDWLEVTMASSVARLRARGNTNTGWQLSTSGTGAMEFFTGAFGNEVLELNATQVKIGSGKNLVLGNAYAAGATSPTGSLILYDSTGTAYKVPAQTA